MSYTYSLSSDFGNNLKSEQFHSEIENDNNITANLIAVNTEGDVVDIIFDASLSSGEETTLNNLISSHVPDDSKEKKQFYIIVPKRNVVRPKNSWVLAAYIRYQGSNNVGTIDYIEIETVMADDITSYDARVINHNTGDVIVQKDGLINTVIDSFDLGTISNVPLESTLLELQIQKNGGKNNSAIEIEQITVYYGN